MSLFGRLRRVRSHTFRGKKYRIVVRAIPDKEEANGFTESPSTKCKKMVIDPRCKVHDSDRELLKTLLDESLHCVWFDIDNDVIDTVSRDIANFLYRAGYRMTDAQPTSVAP
jgi:hypothetical protein